MLTDASSEPSQYRVTLFFGPEQSSTNAATHACVFNVKKRSWKGGIQVSIEITTGQIEQAIASMNFSRWLADALSEAGTEDHALKVDRARELFVQAVCWCKLELLLQSGITQENQCLIADTFAGELGEALARRRGFITSYVATELDLIPRDTGSS